MEVIILAGGFGTRLRSVVNEVPKCMAPIANKPFLWYLLKYLTKFDVSKVILSLGYLRGVIIDWIDECKDEFPFAFEYAVEDEPLGTGGGIKLALKRTSKPNIIVLNGDTFFDVNLNELYEWHCLYPSSITLALNKLIAFSENNGLETVLSDIGILSHRSLLGHAVFGSHEEIMFVVKLLHGNN